MTKKSLQIIEDYQQTGLSVRQIAQKHGVCVRTVYNAVKGKTDRKGWDRRGRRYLSLTRNEAQTILNAIQPTKADYASPIPGIVRRLETIIEDLTY